MSFFNINRNFIAISHDAFMAAISFNLALYIRLGENIDSYSADYLIAANAILAAICVSTSLLLRQYRGLWRYASMYDLTSIVKSVSISMLVFVLALFLLNRLEGVPRSVFFINWMLLLGMLAGPRFIYRSLKDKSLSQSLRINEQPRVPVMLIGATPIAERFIRDMARDEAATYKVVAIIDKDRQRAGRTIHTIRIYDAIESLHLVVQKVARKGLSPQKVIVADDTLDGEMMRGILAQCEALNIPVARLPKSAEMKHAGHDKAEVLPIAVEDLLGRPQQALDKEAIRALTENKIVLVTGAGGTIGGELCRQVCESQPKTLVLFEQSEFNLYEIERQLRKAHASLTIIPILGDIRDTQHVQALFKEHAPQLILHAAAVKHVPLSEVNSEEAILTNVFGTRNIADAALKYNAEAVVMISTDKAVNPTNIMGASKRLAESIFQSLGHQHKTTRFVTVRFGNVLDSAGSVVPLFREQLAAGGPLTVTHPEMTRYFMTVREAVELVLQATALGILQDEKRESLFVLDMGEPVKIVDLAKQMIRLAGLKVGEDIDIIFTGLRAGEKLYEELFHVAEDTDRTGHESIFLASPRYADIHSIESALNKLKTACAHRDANKARALLKELVPEYNAPGEHTLETA